MQMIPYLNFDGRCEEAFRFYEQTFGGTLDIMKFEDAPPSAEMPDSFRGLVLNAALDVGGGMVMGSDSPPGRHVPAQGTHVNVQVSDLDQAERIFQALAEDGTVRMPLEPTFWADRFGMVEDRFGIPWMVNCNVKS